MKMIIAIIGSEDADDLVYELNQHSFFVTKLSTMGGFLKKKSTTLMLGVEDERVEDAISIIKKMSGAREQLVHAADHGRKLLPDRQYDRSDEHESRRSNRICNKCRRISEILIF
ncbi:MAG: cyclic-di-AMP receptor [Clostridium fessum]